MSSGFPSHDVPPKGGYLVNPRTQTIASVVSAIAAVLSVWIGIWHYRATEAKRTELDFRESRQRFLVLLSTISDVAKESIVTGEAHKESDSLGSIQMYASRECQVALLQAEMLLPMLAERKVVTPPEYVILAEESLIQGYRDSAAKYAKIALDASLDPHVRSDSKMVLAQLCYMRGEVDAGHKLFEECIRIYASAEELTSDAQIAGEVQVFVTWCETEIAGGDKSHEKTREIIDRAESLMKRMRNGALKRSGISYFEKSRKEIGYSTPSP